MRRARLVLLLTLAVVVSALAASAPQAYSTTVVVSQVYGGGGNAGATYTHDFVELFNRGSTSASLSGWSIQYASATGTGLFSANVTPLPAITLAPGQYALIQQAQGTGGTTALPTPDGTGSIAVGSTAGKVALVSSTIGLTCNGGSTVCSASQLAQIVDLVGYGNANFFEGGAAAPTLTNTTAAIRGVGGCVETDSNSADFASGAPSPRNTSSPVNTCPADLAPSVSASAPSDGAAEVAVDANVSITFNEPVSVTGSWFTISCTTSGTHSATVTGGTTTFTLDPDTDFVADETCTVTVDAGQVADLDADDPPDAMAADATVEFATVLSVVTPIHDIQGSAHISPLTGSLRKTQGVVTALRPISGTGFYLQDPSADADVATSEAIFVFTDTAPTVAVGDAVQVVGTVSEFRPGGATSTNLTTTELESPTIAVLSSGNALPPATVVGTGGRVPPGAVIDNDATGSVETSGSFDASTDGIDFYESLEGMRVQVNNAVAVGPTSGFGEIPIVGDNGANAAVRTNRGGVVISATDFNPERIHLDDTLLAVPLLNVGDGFSTAVVGVLDYSFGNFKLNVTTTLTRVAGTLAQEVTELPIDQEIAVATYNVENLDPSDATFSRHADYIVNHLRSPDLIAIEEIQDSDGATNSTVTDAATTWNMLIAAIVAEGGPTYQFRQINPVDDQDGGEPGGNIRVGFLFRTDRELEFIDRPGGTSTSNTTVVDHPSGPRLSASPGRIQPTSTAFNSSRKPLVGEFRMRGKKVFVIANHFNSKGGDHPLFGRFQPPVRSSEVQRHQQAQIVNDFVDDLLGADENANVIVLGDINDFEFSDTLSILEGGVLTSLMNDLPKAERYSYDFEGNSQVLDQIIVSDNLHDGFAIEYDVVHVNSEFADQASDHDPQVARIDFRGRP
jgi:predicted extracellular nuclease